MMLPGAWTGEQRFCILVSHKKARRDTQTESEKEGEREGGRTERERERERQAGR